MAETPAVNQRNIPKGLAALLKTCNQIYPDQQNPLQVTTILKFWLGGQEPLDYISMFSNAGNVERGIQPHWHYISYGLSDLHGDGRVHQVDTTSPEPRSGMGFELTFRLLKTKEEIEKNETRPPSWPANLLQDLAKYVFSTGNRLGAGDNIPWGKGLNGKRSRIQHMLIAEDPEVPRTKTPFGFVDFFQVVGATAEELEHASRWNGKGVLNFLKTDPSTGGIWLITDMMRTKSVFELFPETLQQLELDLEQQGSDLAGVNAEFEFKELPDIKTELDCGPLSDLSLDDLRKSQPFEIKTEQHDIDQMICSNPLESPEIPSRATFFSGIEVKFAPYAAKFLNLAIKDRIRHGRHFTFKNLNIAITFVAESVTGSYANRATPYVVMGYWVQVLIPDALIPRMIESLQTLSAKINDENEIAEPITFEWPDYKLKFVIDNVKTQNFNGIQPDPLLQ